jgi:hypothetical protein
LLEYTVRKIKQCWSWGGCFWVHCPHHGNL